MLFQAKSLPQLFYGTILGPLASSLALLERTQSKFVKAVFQMSGCLSNTILCLEAGLLKIKAKLSLASINFWLTLNYYPQELTSLILYNCVCSPWLKAVHQKLTSIGFFPQSLLTMGLDKATALLKQEVSDTERQGDIINFLTADNSRYIVAPAGNLSLLELPTHRKAFSLAR